MRCRWTTQAMPADETVVIRPLAESDIAALRTLETDTFHSGWTEAAYRQELENPASLWRVATENNQLIGFGGLSLIVDEAHVTTLAVAPTHRGRGIGKQILAVLLKDAMAGGAERATLEVAASNTVAQALYKRFGFEHAAIRRNYYPDTGEDADILWIHAMDDTKWRQTFQTLCAEAGIR